MARTAAIIGAESRYMGTVTRHTVPRDFGMHPVEVVEESVLGESDPPASGAALASRDGSVGCVLLALTTC